MLNLIRKYYNAFNFYFGKPILEIMGNLSIDHVILYKDFKILDENKEYLSGYYGKEDQKRIIKAQKIKIPKPNLIIVTAHRIVEKRNTKLLKLQKMAVINYQVQPQVLLFNTTQNNEYLSQFQNSQSSEIQEYQQQQQISWETQSHNIYSSNSISNNTNYSNIQQIINKSNSIQQLYYIINENELSKVIKETNQFTNKLLNKISKKNNISQNKQQQNLIKNNQKQQVNVKNVIIPKLQIPQISDKKSNKINFNQLMQQYDQILQQRFNKGCQTERNQQNKQDIPKQLVYLTNSLHNTQTQNLLKNSSSQFYKSTTCSPSILLKSLSKWTIEQSELNNRRLEIKQNLNKLIKQQEKDLGYYTHR